MILEAPRKLPPSRLFEVKVIVPHGRSVWSVQVEDGLVSQQGIRTESAQLSGFTWAIETYEVNLQAPPTKITVQFDPAD